MERVLDVRKVGVHVNVCGSAHVGTCRGCWSTSLCEHTARSDACTDVGSANVPQNIPIQVLGHQRLQVHVSQPELQLVGTSSVSKRSADACITPAMWGFQHLQNAGACFPPTNGAAGGHPQA